MECVSYRLAMLLPSIVTLRTSVRSDLELSSAKAVLLTFV